MTVPAAQTDNPLTLHAEFLPNIRQISLYITLPVDHPEPTISLSESRRAVTVSLAAPLDVSETIKLPARVNAESRRVLDASRGLGHGGGTVEGNNGQRELSFRMQVDPGDGVGSQGGEVTGDYVPWMAGDMRPDTRVRCRGCENVILDKEGCTNEGDGCGCVGWVWKDLPSGNWAEMMDFWHCHKPDPCEGENEDGRDHGHGHSHQSIEERNSQVKGYGAANRVVATPGSVLVDVATFLVSASDCKGLKMNQADSSNPSNPTSIHCANCDALVGIEDIVASGWRLLKTSLAASTAPKQNDVEERGNEEEAWTTHAPETVVTAQLLELVERESARRFVVHCGGKDGLLLWVFNPTLRYTNTTPKASKNNNTNIPPSNQHGMKILYQHTADADFLLHPESGTPSSLSLEELSLPPTIFAHVQRALIDANEILPVSARAFREWRVGILDRFERGSL